MNTQLFFNLLRWQLVRVTEQCTTIRRFSFLLNSSVMTLRSNELVIRFAWVTFQYT